MPLSPSQRIVLITEISERLANESFSLIDVILKQFSLPWSDRWEGDKESYVLKMIEEASDGTLVDLAQHAGFSLEEVTSPGIEASFWRKGMFKLFVSHLATHKAYAAELQTVLLDFGISAFVAHNDIEPTREWQTQIEIALATCDALVALLHPDFHLSNWTDQEIGFVMGRGVPAFAIRFDQDPYGFIGRFQAFNGSGKTASVLAREVFEAFRKNKQTQRRMNDALVALFEQSGSFAAAKTRIGYLEGLETWNPTFTTRIRSAVDNNSQISGSWDVPERVERLVQKWANGT